MRTSVLVVEDDPALLEALSTCLDRMGMKVRAHDDCDGADQSLEEGDPLLALVDLHCGGNGAGENLIRRLSGNTPVVALVGDDLAAEAVRALDAGADEFLASSLFTGDAAAAGERRLERLVGGLVERERLTEENETLRDTAELLMRLRQERYSVVSKSRLFREVLETAHRLASIPRPVLITGERGVGKELVAAAIHFGGPRAAGPFVTINCAAFTGHLLESELFGHEKGAFTGADRRRAGRFELADGGSLFLDEIGNMPSEFQEKLLRVLEYQRFERVGGNETVEVDVRVIAATNADMDALIEAGEFRADLRDRLAFHVIEVPPLRDRPEDVPPLVDHFSRRMVEEVPGLAPVEFTDESLGALQDYEWPGNVRQLKNLVERLACFDEDRTVHLEELPLELQEAAGMPAGGGFEERVARFERRLLIEAMQKAGGVQKDAAERLGLSYDAFRRRLAKHDLKGDLTSD